MGRKIIARVDGVGRNGKGKALLSRRGGQRKFQLGMEEIGRNADVEDDWDCPPVFKLH
jgi:hypothetical protein